MKTNATTGHTPGPWAPLTVGRPYSVQADTACKDIKLTVCRINQIGHETLANARLIAAAPDLLSALESLLNATAYCNFEQSDEVGKQCYAAIAKAKGQP